MAREKFGVRDIVINCGFGRLGKIACNGQLGPDEMWRLEWQKGGNGNWSCSALQVVLEEIRIRS